MLGETAPARISELFAEIVGILWDVTGEGADWAARITLDSALEGDLGLTSMELADLSEKMRAVFGDRIDMVAYVAGLDIDQLIELRLADLVDYVEGTR